MHPSSQRPALVTANNATAHAPRRPSAGSSLQCLNGGGGSSASPSPALRVLLVEDSPADVHLVREMLAGTAGAQFELAEAIRLDGALDRLAAERFDVVLLDLHLPDSAGLHTLHTLRAQAGSTPIVVLSGADDDRTGFEAVRQGAQDYLVKGDVDAQSLTRALRFACARARVEHDQAVPSERRDEPTGLPDRSALLARAVEALARAEGESEGVAVLEVRLAGLESLDGAVVGPVDETAFATAAARVAARFGSGEVVARTGQAELTVLIDRADRAGEVAIRAQGVLDSLVRPLRVDDAVVVPRVAIGIAFEREGVADADAMLANAHVARQQAQAAGVSEYRLFDPGMRSRSRAGTSCQAGARERTQPATAACGSRVAIAPSRPVRDQRSGAPAAGRKAATRTGDTLRHVLQVSSVLAGLAVGAWLALPVEIPSPDQCPPSGEGLVQCQLSKGWLPAITLISLVGAGFVMVTTTLLDMPERLREWRRLSRLGREGPKQVDALLRAASWGQLPEGHR